MLFYQIRHVATHQANGARTVCTNNDAIAVVDRFYVFSCSPHHSVLLQTINSHGIMHHKFSHIRVVLREIDFPLKIYQQKTLNQKKKWLLHQQRAEQDGKAAMAKRQELEQLMKQQEAQEQERKAAAKKK